MPLTRSQITPDAGTLSNLIRYWVLRGLGTNDIISTVRDNKFKERTTTISALIDYWREARNAGNYFQRSRGSRDIDSASRSNRGRRVGAYQIMYQVDTVLQDGSKRSFFRLAVDVAPGTTRSELDNRMVGHFQRSIGRSYQIRGMSFRVITIEGI